MFSPRTARLIPLAPAAIVAAALFFLSPPSGLAQVPRPDTWITNGTVNATVATSGGVFIGGSFTKVGPATGHAAALDLGSGVAIPPYAQVDGVVNAVASDFNGGWFIGGAFAHVRGQPRHNLAHVDAAGNVTSWEPDPNGEVRCMVFDGNALYLGGGFTLVGGSPRSYLAAVDMSGLAVPWDPEPDSDVLALALDGSTVYAGGRFTFVKGLIRNHLAAIDSAGNPTTWDPNANGSVAALAVHSGTVFAGGSFNTMKGVGHTSLAAIDAAGNPTSFNPIIDGPASAVSVPSSILTVYSIYFGGSFSTVNGASRANLAAMSSDGTLSSWNPSPNGSVEALIALTQVHNTTVYAAGHFTTMSGVTRSHLAAVSGGSVTAWDPEPDANVRAIAVYSGTLFAGGEFVMIGGVPRNNLAEISTQTGMPTGWDPGANGAVNALVIEGGTVFAGGGFTMVGGQTRWYVAGVSIDGTLTNFISFFDGPVLSLAISGSTLFVGGNFLHAGKDTYGERDFIAAIDTTGNALAWNPGADGQVRALALRTLPIAPFSTLVYAGGSFTQCGGVSRSHLAEIDASGAVTSWDPAPVHSGAPELTNVTALAALSLFPRGGTIYVGGDFKTIANQPRQNLAAIDASGVALAWNPNANDVVHAIVPDNGAVFAGGDFTFVHGQETGPLVELDAVNGVPTNWLPNVVGSVNAITSAGNTIYVGGSISSAGGLPVSGLVAFSDPTVDVGEFTPDAGPELIQAAPNPFRDRVTLSFAVPTAQTLGVDLFDASGRLVRRFNRAAPAGMQRFEWDGRDESGRATNPGLYFLRVRGRGFSLDGKVLRLQ